MQVNLNPHLKNYNQPKIIYDLDKLIERARFLKEAATKNNIKLLFAVKSFPNKNVLKCLKPFVDGFEVSNNKEYQLLPDLSHDTVISVNDPILDMSNLENYQAFGNKVVFYNVDATNVINEIKNNPANIQFGLRVSHTQLGIESLHYSKRINASRFGEGMHKILPYLQSNEKLFGIHIHNGSEENTKNSYRLMAESIMHSLSSYSAKVSYINFGGGLHTLSDEDIKSTFKMIRKIIPLPITLIFEPGHAFCRDAGFAIAKIKSIKERGYNEYIVTTDISYECNLKWSIPKYYPTEICLGKNAQYVDVIFYGSSCYENDFIRDCKIEINEFKNNIQKDKLIIFHNINGYAYAWNHGFNGIPQAEIYFI